MSRAVNVVAIFVLALSAACAQRRPPAPAAGQPPAVAAQPREGDPCPLPILAAGLLPVDTTKLRGAVEEGSLNQLYEVLRNQDSDAGGAPDVGGIARLYVDPSTLGDRQPAAPNASPGAHTLTERTMIQVFGEQMIRHEQEGLYCGTDGRYVRTPLEIRRIGLPSGGAKTLQEVLKGPTLTNKWLLRDLSRLEVVAVPLLRLSDPATEAADCACVGQQPCAWVASVTTLVPSALFEQGASSADSASFVDTSPAGELRRTMVNLQHEGSDLINRFGDEQRDKNPRLACISGVELAAWTDGNKATFEGWENLWRDLDSKRTELSAKADEIKKKFPDPPADATPTPAAAQAAVPVAVGRAGGGRGAAAANPRRPPANNAARHAAPVAGGQAPAAARRGTAGQSAPVGSPPAPPAKTGR